MVLNRSPTERNTPDPSRRWSAAAPSGTVARSTFYEGDVVHRRPGPEGHRFTQSVRMLLVDLDEAAALCRLHPLWSLRHPAPVWLRRGDYLGDPVAPLATEVRRVAAEQLGAPIPPGPVSLLTHPRTWGWLFNPISCYYCYGESGTDVVAMVAEVTNTPWHERRCYVFGPPGEHRATKTLHVSPFLPMDLGYRVRYRPPGEHLDVRFDVSSSGGSELVAAMRLSASPVDRHSLGRVATQPLRGTTGVSAGIYRQAALLRLRGATFYPHPERRHPRPEEWRSPLPGADPVEGCPTDVHA